MIRSAKGLSPQQKTAIEDLIGQQLSEQDNISVPRLNPPHVTAELRQEILDGLRSHFARVDAQRQPMPDEEAEETINEALRSAKPNYRPVS